MNRLKQAYHELLDRRTMVRIVPAQGHEQTQTERPIFVIGLYRSGTTLLRYVLDSHSRIAVPPETAFIPELADLINDERCMAGFAGMGFDREHVLSQMRRFLGYFYGNYAQSRGKARWGDKSPNHVDHLEWIAELYPSATFLIITRDALDQIYSFTRGGKLRPAALGQAHDRQEDPRLAAARYWAERNDRILLFAQQSSFDSLVLSYEDLASEPERISRKIFSFLGEDWEASVLRFHEFDHDFGLEDNITRNSTGFRPSRGKWHSWPDEIIAHCTEIVSQARERAGYNSQP